MLSQFLASQYWGTASFRSRRGACAIRIDFITKGLLRVSTFLDRQDKKFREPLPLSLHLEDVLDRQGLHQTMSIVETGHHRTVPYRIYCFYVVLHGCREYLLCICPPLYLKKKKDRHVYTLERRKGETKNCRKVRRHIPKKNKHKSKNNENLNHSCLFQ